MPSLPGQANQVVELNVTGGALGLNKMSKREEAPYAAEDAQVVGLVFHQSKEVLIVDHGAGSNGDVSMGLLFKSLKTLQSGEGDRRISGFIETGADLWERESHLAVTRNIVKGS